MLSRNNINIILAALALLSSARAFADPPADAVINGIAIADHDKRLKALEDKCTKPVDVKTKKECGESIDNEKRGFKKCKGCGADKKLAARLSALEKKYKHANSANENDSEFAVAVKSLKHVDKETRQILAPGVVEIGKKSTLDTTATAAEMIKAANASNANGNSGVAYSLIRTPRVLVMNPEFKPHAPPSPQDYFAPSLTAKHKKFRWGLYLGGFFIGAGVGAAVAAPLAVHYIESETFDAKTGDVDTTGRDKRAGIIVGGVLGGAALGLGIAAIIDFSTRDNGRSGVTAVSFAPTNGGGLATVAGRF